MGARKHLDLQLANLVVSRWFAGSNPCGIAITWHAYQAFIAPGSPWENGYVERFNGRPCVGHKARHETAAELRSQLDHSMRAPYTYYKECFHGQRRGL